MGGSSFVGYLLLLFVLCLLAPVFSADEARLFLREFDLSYYRPQVYNLRDFKVEARIDELSKRLSRQLIFGKLDDVFFKISWLIRNKETGPDQTEVTVMGLPNGFVEIKSQLANNILPRIDFIAPVSLSEKMKDYDLQMSTDKDGSRSIVCKDPESIKDASEIVLVFDQKKRLRRFVIKRPIGLETVDLKLVKEPWSQGKWVLSEYNVKKVHGVQTIEAMSTLDYKVVAGLGLPERIETKMKAVVARVSSAERLDAYEGETSSTMRFSNWEVNTGAKREQLPNNATQ